MATTNAGWVSVRTMRGRFEDRIPLDSQSTDEPLSEPLLQDSLDDVEENISSRNRDSPLNEVEKRTRDRHYFRQCSDDRLARRRDSYEFRVKGNEHKITPRRLQSDEGPCVNGDTSSSSRKLPGPKGYHRRDRDPELLAWKSLQNVNVRPVKLFESRHNRDQVSSLSSDGSEEMDSLGKKQGRDIYVKVNRIRESISPVVLRRKSNYDVTPEDKSIRMRHERKFLDQNSSPVLDFRERKLAFEKAVGALDERFKSLTKSTLRNRSSARKLRSDESTNNFPAESSKYSSSKNSSESVSANSSFEAEESFRHSSSSYPRHSRTSKFGRLRPTSSSTGSSKSSNNSSPRITKGVRKNVFDFDSEKEIDSTELQENRLESPVPRSNDAELNLRLSQKVKERDGSETEDEEIPVFCVQDYVRGRERTRRESPARSRSEGDGLKTRSSRGLYSKVHKQEADSRRNATRSSNGANRNDSDKCLKLAFRDKQRMLEDIMNSENALKAAKYTRARSCSPQKGSSVFRKISFTSKSDKERQNKIARGRLSINHSMPTKQVNQVDNSNEVSGKKPFAKLLPKIAPFPPSLRLPLATNERAKLDVKDSPSSNSNGPQKKNSSIIGKNEAYCAGKFDDVESQVKESAYFEKNKSNEADHRKSLPEIDQMELQTAISSSHRRNKSNPNEVAVASVLSSSYASDNVDLSFSKPIKPSELYDSKRSRKYSDFTNDSSGDNVNYSSLPISSSAPVRPPRRRNSEFPRKKSKAPQPPSQVQPLSKSDEESAVREQPAEHFYKSESSPVSTAPCSPQSENATSDSTIEDQSLLTDSKSHLNSSSSPDNDRNRSDISNSPIPLPMTLPGMVSTPCSDHLYSTTKISNSDLPNVAGVDSPDASKSLSDISFLQSVSLGPRPYQVTPQPVLKAEPNLNTTQSSSSPEPTAPFSSMAPSTRQVDHSGASLRSDSTNISEASHEKPMISPTTLKAPVNLPPGPPPQKPPRTFAYDIYTSKTRSDSPVNNFAASTSISSLHPPPKMIEPSVAQGPLYSVVNKKNATPKHHASFSPCPKPTIAPKPSHIKTLFKNKRLSLAEPTINSSTREDSLQNSDFKTFSNLRYSFRKNPPDIPPPEPPKNPKPTATKSVPTEPASMCNHYSEPFVRVKEGKLNRQRSISDETLCSSSGYHRVAGDPPREHIYATPDLDGGQRRKAGSGGELHYLCSDLVRGRRGSQIAELPDRRANASPSNLISAWKHEFRQSCRLMQSKIKKSVNR